MTGQNQPQMPQQGYPQQPGYQQVNYNASLLKTNRSLLVYVLLGIVTLGIYVIYRNFEMGESINRIASPYDGKKTMNYIIAWLLSIVTFGIFYYVWMHMFTERVGNELERRGCSQKLSIADFWLWGVLGSFIIIGPFIFFYRLFNGMNELSASFNVNGR